MRDQLLVAVTARLEHITAAQDPALALEPEALDDALRLAGILGDDGGDIDANYALGWFHWYRYLALPEGQDSEALNAASRALTLCFVAGAEGLPETLLPLLADDATETAFTWLEQAQNTTDRTLITATVLLWQRIVAATLGDHPDRAQRLSSLAFAMSIRHGRTGSFEDLEKAIITDRQAVDSAPEDHPDRAMFLNNLGVALRARFERTGSPEDLEEVVITGRRAVDSAAGDHPDRAMFLYNLGVALRARFERTGSSDDLEEMIIRVRRAVDSVPTHDPKRAVYLSGLVAALYTRFMKTGVQGDLSEVIAAGRAAVETTPIEHPDRAMYLSNLGVALSGRFKRMGVRADLDESIIIGRAAVEAVATDHPNRAWYLSNLGDGLRTRFTQTGFQADLDEAITIGRAAVEAAPSDHPNRVVCLSNLGGVLQTRFDKAGALADLDEAIAAARTVVEATPTNHVNRGRYLHNLGVALITRFERMGGSTDLDEAITTARAAVQTTLVNQPDGAEMLSILGTGLRTRFEREGALEDLDEAIITGRVAVEATAADHPDRALRLKRFSDALRRRFERTGAQIDLEQAITAARSAVEATGTDHRDRATMLHSFSCVLHARFERTGVQADLDEAISAVRRAVQVIPGRHTTHAMCLTSLCNFLGDRFRLTGAQADLDEAVAAGHQAVQAAPDDSLRAACLSNLGITLRAHFERTGAQTDLNEAIDTSRAAVEATPTDHPDRAPRLFNLGVALRTRGTQTDLDEAAITYAQAAEVVSAVPSVRINAARWAAWFVAQTDVKRAARLQEMAVRLLPQMASRRLDRGDQQHALGEFAGLASDAAALALADCADDTREEPAVRALRLLELGRGVMLSQALDTRSDLTDLQAQHPTIAERFIKLRDQFDQGVDTPVLIDGADVVAGHEERRLADRHQLATAFTTTVAEVRSLDGFETFLLPPEPGQLIRHARQGPVVVVNVSQYRSDALLLSPEGITSIPLRDLVQDAVIDRINSFHQALETAHDPDASSDQRSNAQDTLSAVLEWLWDAVARPILDELGYRRTPVPGTAWPRLWWAPGGLLSFLPLHAAGYHREPPEADGRSAVMDRVVSSYTPTVRALGYARERNTVSIAAERAVIVAMPTTPGIDSPLRYVADEAELIHRRLPGSTLLIEDPATANTHTPTKSAVLAHLGGCAIAHFACHGSSHPGDPSQSLLHLHDYDTDPLTVASLAPIRLDQARLAYLSACRTAFNPSTGLIDEAIHLTTAFQLAGYPHVVGTLWEIDDALAVRVADTFYTALVTGENTIDTRGAAQALHHAVRAIRDELPATPSLWAAYLHAGA